MVRSNDSSSATRGDVRRSEENIRRELKEEVFSVRRDLSLEIVRLQSDVSGIRATMATLATKDDVNRILDAVDAFAGKAQNYDRASILHGQTLTEVQVQMKNHESRITALESRPSVDPAR
jgi:hypothetical protein